MTANVLTVHCKHCQLLCGATRGPGHVNFGGWEITSRTLHLKCPKCGQVTGWHKKGRAAVDPQDVHHVVDKLENSPTPLDIFDKDVHH
jgi:hypothetical protein